MTAEAAVPRRVRRGPPIALTCKCGERRELRYGDRWTCETCGRSWNTLRIPMEQYAAIRQAQLRYRRAPLIVSLVVLACIVTLVVIGKAFGAVILVAFAAMGWSSYVRPGRRRGYRESIANLPSWDIEPE